MKKILFATTGVSSAGYGGGISSYVHDLAEDFVSFGNEVTVLLIGDKKVHKVMSEIKYDLICCELPSFRAGEFDFCKEIYNLIKKINPDVIINNDVPCIAGLWPFFDAVKISVVHGFKKGFTFTNFNLQKSVAFINHHYCDWIVCQNNFMVEELKKEYKNASHKIICIHQTASLSQSRNNISNKELNIIFAGGNSRSKGADVASKVAKALQQNDFNFKFHWCLPAPKYSKQFVNDNRFLFHGNLARHQFIHILSQCDIILIPTTMDTGPQLLVEAFACGVIPLCNNCESAIPDLVGEDEYGFIIQDNAIEDYVGRIQFLKNDSENLKQKNCDMFKEKLSPIHRYEKYKSIISKKQSYFPLKERLEEEDVFLFHLRDMMKYSTFSSQRIINKIFTVLAIPINYRAYNKWYKLFWK